MREKESYAKHAQPTRLGKILELCYGKGLTDNERVKGNIPVYGSNGLVGYHNKALVNTPTIIVGRKGSAGALNLVKEPCFPIDTTYYVKTSNDIEYIYYLLQAANLPKIAQKGVKPGLNRNEVYEIKVQFVSDITEQQKIAEKLNQQMVQIEIMKKEAELQLTQINELSASILNKVFNIGDQNNGKK